MRRFEELFSELVELNTKEDPSSEPVVAEAEAKAPPKCLNRLIYMSLLIFFLNPCASYIIGKMKVNRHDPPDRLQA